MNVHLFRLFKILLQKYKKVDKKVFFSLEKDNVQIMTISYF